MLLHGGRTDIVPDPLEVCGLGARSGACYQEVTAIVKEELDQAGITSPPPAHPFIRREIRPLMLIGVGRSQMKFDPVKELAMVADMGITQGVVLFGQELR